MNSSSQSRQKDLSPGKRRADEINDQKNTCLYIGNIDKKVDSKQLNQIFAKYGDLEYCYLVYEPSSSDRHSKQIKISRGYGFAKFIKMDDLMKAKNQLDGYQINGRKIKVQISKRNKPREQTPGRYLGKKRHLSPQNRHRGRSHSRSSSDSYYNSRRHHQRKQKHTRKKRQRSRQSRERSRSRDRDRNRERDRQRDRDRDYRRKKRSISNQHQRRREKQ